MQFAQLVVENQGWTSIFARRTSVRASTTLARVVPKSVCAPQCFDFKSYFFVWWESWVKINLAAGDTTVGSGPGYNGWGNG